MSQITVRIPQNLNKKVGQESVLIDAGNVKDALEKLKREFKEEFSEDLYIFLLNGRIINKRKLGQTKLSAGDTLHIFLPVFGG